MNMHVVELPDETEAWARSKAEAEGFLTLSDYMVFLVEQKKDADALRDRILANDPVPVSRFDDAYFAKLTGLARGGA